MRIVSQIRNRGLTLGVVVLLLPPAVLARMESPSHFQSNYDARLRIVVDQFYDAFARKDPDRLMSLWSLKAPDLASRKQQFQQLFAAYSRIEIRDIVLSRIATEEAKASARITFDLVAVDERTGKPATGPGKQIRTLHFVKEADAWKIWSYGPAANELASALIASQTEQERAALLAADKELVSVELRRGLISQGDQLKLKGDYARAITAYQIAQTIAEQIGDQEGVAWSLSDIGTVYLAQSNYSIAMEYLGKGLKQHQALGNKPGTAYSLKFLGDVHRFLGDDTEALTEYRTSLETYEAIGNKTGTAFVLDGIGGVYSKQGDFVQALEYYRKALALQEALANKQGIAGALASIGYVHGARGDYAEALECYQKTLSIVDQLGDKGGSAYALMNIGAVHLAQSNYRRALEYYQKGLDLFESLGNREGIASALNYIGIVHRTQGNYDLALEYLRRSLALHEQNRAKQGIARSSNSIGNLQYAKGDYAAAIDSYRKSLAMYEASGDKSGIATEWDNLGGATAAQGDYAKATDYLKRSLALCEAVGLKAGISRTLGRLAYVERAQGNFAEALLLSDRSATIARQLGNLDAVWYPYTIAGRAYLGLDQPEKARKALDDAITAIEALRSEVTGGEQDRERFFEDKLDPYRAMVELLISQGNNGEALAYAERAKGRVLFDVLRSGRVNITKAMTSLEQDQEKQLIGQLVSLNTQLYREQLRGQPDPGRVSILTAQLQTARLQHEAFQATLYARHPVLRAQRGNASPIDANEALALLPDAKTALLEYVVTDEITTLFVLTRGTEQGGRGIDLQSYAIHIKQKDLAELVDEFRTRLANRDFGFVENAQRLYRLLIKPAQAQLRGKTSLIVAPDTVLWALPFQALQIIDGHYLIEDCAVSYVPSLTVLREMIQARRRVGSTDRITLLAFGNPALGRLGSGRGASLPEHESVDPLPEAERQVKTLGELYGPRHSKVFIGPEAREDLFKAEAQKYQILHLATHGVVNDASPMYSHIMLSPPADGSTEDGLLEAWEIMRMNLTADLVVLSACETARGRIGAGEGVIGLSWAFFVAGCPTALVSQWKVESASTTDLMLAFHRALRPEIGNRTSHLAVAQALRKAELKLMRSDRYAHPFFWAGFVVIGDG